MEATPSVALALAGRVLARWKNHLLQLLLNRPIARARIESSHSPARASALARLLPQNVVE